LRSDYEYVRDNGLQVDSCDGSFTQTDLLLKNPATRQLIKDQMMEVIGAAQHLGAAISTRPLPTR